MWYARAMILHLVRVVALLVAACLAPSLAYAHAGHTHHADHALAPADIAAPVTAGHQDQIAATVIVKTAVASAPSSADRVGCVGHCCSGVAGMPCCGAVLVPETYDQAARDWLARSTPLERLGGPADVVAAVLYLLEGGDYVTGTTLVVDGGRRVRTDRADRLP